MGLTNKRHYDRYTLAFKIKAVRESNKRGVRSKDVAEALGIHPVMLYRWRQEYREGRLSEAKDMKTPAPPPKKCRKDSDALKVAQRKIKELEKRLADKEEEVVILKKAKRFFSDRNKKNTIL